MGVEDYIGEIEHVRRLITAFTSPKRCYGDFVARLSQPDIDRALQKDVEDAIASDSWDSVEQYLESFENDEETHLFQVVDRELENVFVADGQSEIVERLAASVAEDVRDPLFCAKHLAGRHLLNRKLAVLYGELRRLQIEAELEIGEAEQYGRDGHVVQRLRDLLHPVVEETLKDKIRAMSGFFRLASIDGSHGLFVPDYCELTADSIRPPSALDLVIATIGEKPELISSIDPHDFESVIAHIFKEKGVGVELTAATRDGGRDIICTSYDDGGTMRRTAIEVKRYTKQKVTFSKITSFVGANFINYRDMMYVTTSSYTRPAEDYAALVRATPNVDRLELKKREDVLEWAKAHKTQMLVDRY